MTKEQCRLGMKVRVNDLNNHKGEIIKINIDDDFVVVRIQGKEPITMHPSWLVERKSGR